MLEDLRTAHNSRVHSLDSVWCFASFETTYKEDNGQIVWQFGDGYLAVLTSRRAIYLQWQRLGEAIGTMACNEAYFWVVAHGPDAVFYVGRNKNAYSRCCAAIPGSLHPLDVLPLTGAVIVPREATRWEFFAATALEPERVAATFQPEGGHVPVRLLIRTSDAVVTQAYLLEPGTDEVIAASVLSDYRRFGDATVPFRLVMTSPRAEGQVRILIHEARRAPHGMHEIRPTLFDLNEALRGHRGKRVVLDSDCAEPALPHDLQRRP